MDTEFVIDSIDVEETATKEYSLLIDGVLELEIGTNIKSFFDGLLDTIIEYVERHNGVAGLSLSHREYDARESDGDEEEDGAETA